MSKKVAIVQSSYIPWKGYFDLIGLVEEFILLDDAQFTKRDWRNRNKIKTAHGPKWLTIPVMVKGRYTQRVRDVIVSDKSWAQKHWSAIRHSYANTEQFSEYARLIEVVYGSAREPYLSLINYRFINVICASLGIQTKISWSMEYELVDGKTERLVHLCRQAGATEYVSGPAARSYIKEELFQEAGISLSYMDYSGYPEYPQPYPPFEHGVSVLDLLFSAGRSARTYIKSGPSPVQTPPPEIVSRANDPGVERFFPALEHG